MDEHLLPLLPHRPPMLLIDTLVDVSPQHARARVHIGEQSAFFEAGRGVGAWIGIEYMGQTCALIAGHQKQLGQVEPHLGLLLGTRKYRCSQDYFPPGATLLVSAEELAVVGDQLANFTCRIVDEARDIEVATARLSVLRKPLESTL